MNSKWSEMNKLLQLQLKKESTFSQGIATLLDLRNLVFEEITAFKNDLDKKEFSAMPFMNANGYHNKTIAYSLWHIFRIEDIVAHTLIKGDEQVFFSGDYQKKTASSIITTGNELAKAQISEFSEKLDLNALYNYITEVKDKTDVLLKELSFSDLKRKITDNDRKRLVELNVVSNDENAVWLIDYWCNKDVGGLVQMPFSRHWIMHVEASLRIEEKLKKQRF